MYQVIMDHIFPNYFNSIQRSNYKNSNHHYRLSPNKNLNVKIQSPLNYHTSQTCVQQTQSTAVSIVIYSSYPAACSISRWSKPTSEHKLAHLQGVASGESKLIAILNQKPTRLSLKPHSNNDRAAVKSACKQCGSPRLWLLRLVGRSVFLARQRIAKAVCHNLDLLEDLIRPLAMNRQPLHKLPLGRAKKKRMSLMTAHLLRLLPQSKNLLVLN